MIPFIPYYTPFSLPQWYPRLPYPKVDTKIFKNSVKSFRFLMEQGSYLLDRLEDSAFALKMMEAAQIGKKTEVDRLVKSIGLKVPVTVQYTPSGVIFTLYSHATPQVPSICCNLTISMKWGY